MNDQGKVALSLGEEINNKLKALAEKFDLNKSQYLRHIIRREYDAYFGPPPIKPENGNSTERQP